MPLNLAPAALPAATPPAVATASAPQAPSTTPDAGGDGGFARALQQARQGQRDGAGAPAAKAQAQADATKKSTTRGRDESGGRQADEAAGPPADGLPASADGDAAETITATAEERADDGGPARPMPADDSLPPWLPADEAARALGLTRAGGDDDDTGRRPLRRRRAGRARSAPARRTGRPGGSRAGGHGPRRGSRVVQPGIDRIDRIAEASPLPEHTLHTPLHSPGFAPALGAQLTLLIKDGVTAARLHLNPAEMGPISVQIQLDGSQARIEMAAEHGRHPADPGAVDAGPGWRTARQRPDAHRRRRLRAGGPPGPARRRSVAARRRVAARRVGRVGRPPRARRSWQHGPWPCRAAWSTSTPEPQGARPGRGRLGRKSTAYPGIGAGSRFE